MRDWKQISNMAIGRSEVFLEDPGYDLSKIKSHKNATVVNVGGPSISFPPTEFSPKAVRRFLWEHRKTRGVSRSRSVLRINRLEDSIELCLAALTHKDAAVRLEA